MHARKPPTVADVRAGGQPPGLTRRRNEEHWAGRLYMRAASPYLSWLCLRIGFSPNQLTYLMIMCGTLGGATIALSSSGPAGLVCAVAGALLIQVYLLLDCSDGEVARYSERTSITGVYLDRIGHYLAEVAVLIGLGFRAQGELKSGGWVELGLVAALGAALVKAETDNVVVARAKAGLPAEPACGAGQALRPRSGGLALARRLALALRLHRIIGAVELSLLILVAALLDVYVLPATGPPEWTATRLLMAAVTVVAVLQTVLHFVSIVASRRLW